MSKKAILFDLDGTLLATNEDLAAALNFMRRSFDLEPLPLDTVAGLLGNGIRDLIRQNFLRYSDLTVTEDMVDRAFKINMEYYMAHPADLSKPYSGVVPTLTELKKRGAKLVVVTNKHSDAARKIMELTGLNSFFDFISGDGENIPLKPEPDLLLNALKKMNCLPENALMIGDNHTDIGSARRAGVRSVFVTYGYGVTGDEKPDFIINDFDELLG